MRIQRNLPSGFTLTEVLTAIIIGMLIILIVSNVFILHQRVFQKGNIKAELIQNGRIATDLISRELRQAKKIVTTLSTDSASAPNALLFEDGHNLTALQYIQYDIDESGNLHRKLYVYYFDSDPSTYVHYDDVDAFGSPVQMLLEDKVVAEYINELKFWGNGNIMVELNLEKQTQQATVNTTINPRNL